MLLIEIFGLGLVDLGWGGFYICLWFMFGVVGLVDFGLNCLVGFALLCAVRGFFCFDC